MAYLTFAEVAKEVKGTKRLLEILAGTGDTADVHPYFDSKAAETDATVNAALEQGGYVTPLAVPLTDGPLRNAWLGLMLHALLQTDSGKEAWVEKLYAAALAHLAKISNREGITVIGAAEDEESGVASVIGTFEEEAVFDLGDPYAQVHDVYADLGRPRRWRH